MASRHADPADEVLTAVYAALDALFATSSCPRSTRCCRFAKTGRTPMLWPVEARRVARALARRGGRVPEPENPGDCPLVGKDGGCTIYADRPFGCRTYFCGDATLPEGPRRAEVHALAQRLRTASEHLGERELWPLTSWLGRLGDKERKLKAVRR